MEIPQHYRERYLFEEWTELCNRVAKTIAQDDAEFEAQIYDVMYEKRFIPAGNTLVAGVKPLAPNCSILGLLTDYNFDEKLELSCKLWRQGTGIGFDLSGLSDPVASLHKLSSANDAIDLQHRPKRGNMAVLSAEHPKIMDFVHCKARDATLYNFNISVIYSDTISGRLLDAIVAQAYLTGDPGLIFLKRGQNYGPVDASAELGEITTCVPCGEQFMHAYETCNLGSVNLNSDALMDEKGLLDTEKLYRTVCTGVEILDRVINHLVYPDEKMRQVSLDARRIGLGVTGWADYLKRIDLPYDSDEARRLASGLSQYITATAEEKSRELAKILGPCKYSDEFRNLSLTCIAPTGGITGLLGLRGYAIEPFFEDAVNLDYKAHIDMQAAWQSGMHNAVSKTVNLPADATAETVEQAYNYAAGKGCKGITIYRDSSKDDQPRSLHDCVACEENVKWEN